MVLFCISLETLGSLAIWVYGSISFLSDRTQFVRLPGAVSKDSPVLSTSSVLSLAHCYFIIMISDINKDILSSKIISFADDTRGLY